MTWQSEIMGEMQDNSGDLGEVDGKNAALRAVLEKAAELQPYEGQDYDGGWIDAMDEIRAAIEREIGRTK